MMFKDISWTELLELQAGRTIVPIDVRSPGEFENATIPGSLNIPLFDDRERAEVGTLYTQVGVEAAKERGLEIVSAKLPSLIKEFARIKEDKLVFCWRGGMRSRTTATLLSLMDIYTYRLTGGYRAYRQWVVRQLETMTFRPEAVVLQGHTGTGKTHILRALKQDGYPVIDLEGMAGHRGSIFGAVGLKPRNQKMFDALLVRDLMAYQHSPYVLLEAESRRIGKVTVPPLIYDKRSRGFVVRIELPVEARVRQILKEYAPTEHAEACCQAFQRIRSKIHTPIAAEIDACLKAERYEPAVEMLLTHYYDPLYRHSSEQWDAGEHRTFVVRAKSVDEACREIRSLLDERMPGN